MARGLRRPLPFARGCLDAPHALEDIRLALHRAGAAVLLPKLPEGGEQKTPRLGVARSEDSGFGSEEEHWALGSQQQDSPVIGRPIRTTGQEESGGPQ